MLHVRCAVRYGGVFQYSVNSFNLAIPQIRPYSGFDWQFWSLPPGLL